MQLAAPAYHGAPSTSIFALNGFARRFLRPGPHVSDAPEAVLERPVGLLDHRCVEAGAGHDGELLAVEAADVELPPLSPEADRQLPARCPAGCRGLSPAGSRCRPGGSRAQRPSLRLRRCSAARSRRRPRRRSAPPPRRERASPASARIGSSAPRSTVGRRLPGAPARCAASVGRRRTTLQRAR